MEADEVTQEDLIAAWRQAVLNEPETSEATTTLTVREICTEVFGWVESDYLIKKTRRIVRRWLEDGVVTRAQKRIQDISGKWKRVPAFKLVDDDKVGQEVSEYGTVGKGADPVSPMADQVE